jgi:hypothetical protein
MSEPVLVARVRCDLCGSMVTKITNCICGCGVATCGLCGTHYHILEKPKGKPNQWWTA